MAGNTSVLVTGAPGPQGGATAREVPRHGHTAHALVRDPDKAQAAGTRGC